MKWTLQNFIILITIILLAMWAKPILADVFSGSTPKEILAFERKNLEDLHLDVLLTPGRRNGVHGMLQKIREYALK